MCTFIGGYKSSRAQQRKVFRQGIHWVCKNTAAPRSDQLWSLAACRSLLNKP